MERIINNMEDKEKRKIKLVTIIEVFVIILLVISVILLVKNMFKTEDTFKKYSETSVNSNSDNNSTEKIVTKYRDNANRTNPNGRIKMTVKDITDKDEEKIINLIGISKSDFENYKRNFMEISSSLNDYMGTINSTVNESTIKNNDCENCNSEN